MLSFFSLTLLFTVAFAHSFLSVPHPISNIDGCRIGGTGGFIGNCPGPCPNYAISADASPSNPSAIFHRGTFHRVVWTRNNHEGGFVRWSLVPLSKMHSKEWHAKMAFHYNCWNVGRFSCNHFDFHRDCKYDRDNEAYSKMLYIPPIYPDGEYVLGWTWYGGGMGSGHFGDYYDCAYVRVSGGVPLEASWTPDFAAGGGSMHEDGCEATVNDLGICWEEPCLPMRRTSKYTPKQFENGTPPPVLSEWFGNGTVHTHPSVKLERLHLLDSLSNRVLIADLNDIILLNRHNEISLLAETRGPVSYVEWYVNGRARGMDFHFPYTIAGDFDGSVYPWMHPLFNRRVRVTVKVVGEDKTFAWGSAELRFAETHKSGAAGMDGVTLQEFQEELGDHQQPFQQPASDEQSNVIVVGEPLDDVQTESDDNAITDDVQLLQETAASPSPSAAAISPSASPSSTVPSPTPQPSPAAPAAGSSVTLGSSSSSSSESGSVTSGSGALAELGLGLPQRTPSPPPGPPAPAPAPGSSASVSSGSFASGSGSFTAVGSSGSMFARFTSTDKSESPLSERQVRLHQDDLVEVAMAHFA